MGWVDLLDDDYNVPKPNSAVEFVNSKAAFEDGFFDGEYFFECRDFLGKEHKNTFKISDVNYWRYRTA